MQWPFTLSPTETVLCTNVSDVTRINNLILRATFPESDIFDLLPHTNATASDVAAKSWLADSSSAATIAAIGARIVVTDNISASLANGSTLTVRDFRRCTITGQVVSLYVVSDMDGSQHTLRRTSYDFLRIENHCFRKATFPLLLGYAMTVHRAQGATLRSPVHVYIRNAFAPSLAYVALSRVDSVSRLRIVTEFCTPDMFIPAPIV